jgi:hypothetical protein
MFTTTALVACGDVIAAPCPHCGTAVLVTIDHAETGMDHALAGALPHGTGRCRGCRQPLSAASIRVPHQCWQGAPGDRRERQRHARLHVVHGA